MQMPTARVWLATFVALIFTIGLLAGVVLERLVLHPADGRGPGIRGEGPRRVGGPGGPGGPGTPGQGSGRRGGGRGGPGPGPMFGPPPSEYVDELGRQVQLTDAQRTQILTLLQSQETRMRQMQDDARRVFVEEQQGLHDRIAAVLTPEQATTFRNWVTQRTGLRGRGPQ